MQDILVFEAPLSTGERVRLLRISRKLRQTDIAWLAGTSQQEVSALERSLPIRREVAQKILKALGLDGGQVHNA